MGWLLYVLKNFKGQERIEKILISKKNRNENRAKKETQLKNI